MEFKEKYEDYTEEEFLEFLREFFHNSSGLKGDDYAAYNDKMILHFEKLSEHPSGSDVLFYPDGKREDSPEGIMEEVKSWRAKNGRPGFKHS
ncbi:bacteriocin immunity protein [Acerihabitans sp. TG2]|uniref:bacteriocin immunity protein n=1 Tax=Acerihabitans sp. TG2 TaxID=3096008 RepID=UPI002B23842E|nr:bacteriocin immunity protein [Acerihabitans sp. TG2]MEA9390694.1 bacteriocin immunity protein [Acerihabitans sp. TG2]